MKQIKKDELYENLSQFLKSKGIELKEGSYTKGIHAGCSFLADTINLSQTGLERARVGIDRKLDQVRRVIHQKTAPKPPIIRRATRSATAKSSARKRKARDQRPKSKSKNSQS